MYRAPARPQRSPGAPRPAGRFPSPSSCWGFGARSPYGGSPRGGPAYSPGSPVYSPGFNRGHRDGSPYSGFGGGSRGCGDSPAGFGGGSRGCGDSPAGFGGGSRGCGGQMWRRGGGFRRPQHFSPASAHNVQSSDSSLEKYFSPAMLQDPWAALQPVSDADRRTAAS